jgi:hypothetical protein
LDKDLLKAAAQNVVEKNLKDSQEEEILNFETLFDFINYKSVVSLQEKAELSYNNLQVNFTSSNRCHKFYWFHLGVKKKNKLQFDIIN